jgi:hypothetical protein
MVFLSIQHSFRWATEPGTREGGWGVGGYTRSLTSMHGWADGDEFYVNYVGHPFQGAIAGFVWVQNDRRYRLYEFGRNSGYWKSRLRALGFSWAYSTQFELGPVSEASIGAIQARHPQHGFVDHVVTPTFGLGWMVVEDALDRYLIQRLEQGVANGWARLALRGGLNPARSMANVLRGKHPWHRETRSGVFRREIHSIAPPPERDGQRPELAAVQLTLLPRFQAGSGGVLNGGCGGAGAEVAFRMSPVWQVVADVSGCKQTGLPANTSGDGLTYVVGPRWTPSPEGRWNPYLQVLVGGTKLTQEEVDPETQSVLIKAAQQKGHPAADRSSYVRQMEASGLALIAGTGINFRINRAASFRVASVEYQKAWLGETNGMRTGSGLQLRTGVTLELGTW